jgi:hypothetical protein
LCGLAALVGAGGIRGLRLLACLVWLAAAGSTVELLRWPWGEQMGSTTLEARLYALIHGPLPRAVDLSGAPARVRRFSDTPREWIGRPPPMSFLGDGVLAAGDMRLQWLQNPGMRYRLASEVDGEVLDVAFDDRSRFVVKLERAEDGRIGVEGSPLRSDLRLVHDDLRAALNSCGPSAELGVVLELQQGWTAEEAVQVCLSARHLIGEQAACGLSFEARTRCRHDVESEGVP